MVNDKITAPQESIASKALSIFKLHTATMNLEKLSDYITCLQFVFNSFSVLALYAFFCICSVSCQSSLNVLSRYFHNNNWKDNIILWPKFSLISLYPNWIYRYNVSLQKSSHAPVFELRQRFILYTVNCFPDTIKHCRLQESKKLVTHSALS